MKDNRNTRYVVKECNKFYQNIDTKASISEHDYHFLSDIQKSKMRVYIYKPIKFKVLCTMT